MLSKIVDFLKNQANGFKLRFTFVWPGEKGLKTPDNYKERKDAVEEIIEGMDKKKGGKNGDTR